MINFSATILFTLEYLLRRGTIEKLGAFMYVRGVIGGVPGRNSDFKTNALNGLFFLVWLLNGEQVVPGYRTFRSSRMKTRWNVYMGVAFFGVKCF